MKLRAAKLGVAAVAVALVAVAAASAHQAKKSVSGSVSVIGVWTGPEQKRFEAVLAGFIGSPAMNLVEATLGRSNGWLQTEIGSQRLELDSQVLAARPALASFVGARSSWDCGRSISRTPQSRPTLQRAGACAERSS